MTNLSKNPLWNFFICQTVIKPWFQTVLSLFYILQMIIWGKKNHDADKIPGHGSVAYFIHKTPGFTFLWLSQLQNLSQHWTKKSMLTETFRFPLHLQRQISIQTIKVCINCFLIISIKYKSNWNCPSVYLSSMVMIFTW